ncbi:uncharacterized protein LOC120212826 isoform X4 [Hibiscus syriacus]|uniref:uncharacterized protein LOC120212826 isoform X4 n=1 Tax=Hibiscus syriacus TaxID=106335 RepID=UPI0019224ABA|nr:uncharacterized protein LOC120212826 isoform X4 [Hibiscus syriacus]
MEQENKRSEYSMHGINSDGFKAQDSKFLKSRQSSETHVAPSKSNEDGIYDFQGPEAKELHLRVSAQKEEIQRLREQIAVACVKELQLLNEKCALERKFSDLRMAIHEKQNESITSASNELARRKGDLEENLKLTHDLKAAEDERYIFMSSLLGLLAEHDLWPHVVNASTITSSVKYLHDQLEWKIRTSHAGHGFSPTNQYPDEQHHMPPENMMRYMHDNDYTAKNLMFNDLGQQRLSNGTAQEFLFNSDRGGPGTNPDSAFDRGFVRIGSEDTTNDVLYQPDEMASQGSEDGPGIEGFQIIGDATREKSF